MGFMYSDKARDHEAKEHIRDALAGLPYKEAVNILLIEKLTAPGVINSPDYWKDMVDGGKV